MRKAVLLAGLALLAAIGGFIWYSKQPEQQINGAIDDFLEAIDHQRISMETDEDVRRALDEVLVDPVTIIGIPAVSEEPMSIDSFAGIVSKFHQLTTLCEIREESRSLLIVGNKAQVYRTVNVTVAGMGRQREERWELVFDLEESDRWRIKAIRGELVN